MILQHPLTTRLLLLALSMAAGYGWARGISLNSIREGKRSSEPKTAFDRCVIVLFLGVMPLVALVSCAALIRSFAV